MSLHNLVPLLACLLNVLLAALAIYRNPGSRLNRLFAYFVSALALWNLGVFGLRLAETPGAAYAWEVLIHLGLIGVPVLYYHFVLVFLDSTARHRRSLALGYALAAAFGAANLSPAGLLLRDVAWTYWGWAPAAGPLYLLFFVYLYAFFIAGLVRLARAYPAIESSFRRNRVRLVMVGTALTLAGGLVDFIRFIAVRFWPAAEQIYPIGIPANMLCALLLGVSIVRYRMFDTDAAAKKVAVYGGFGAVLTGGLAALTWALEWSIGSRLSAWWLVAPLGVVMALLLSPLGQRAEALIGRATFSRRQGCHDTLVALSKRMSPLLDLGALMDTLMDELVRGIPLTHVALLTYDEAAHAFTVARQRVAGDGRPAARPVAADSRLVEWLRQSAAPLVKEELKLNPRIGEYFDTAESELEEVEAAIIVPIKVESKLIGILLLGEKLSGEVFDDQELELLALLANQAAISLENARLYAELATSNARLLEASRLKSQFLASVSHELRTPLNSIIGFSKVLLNGVDGQLNERQQSYVASIHRSSQHLLQLINSILDISRIEAGKVELACESLRLSELVDECIEATLPLARGKPLRIEADVPDDLPVVWGDRTRLRQVLLNLLSNAVKFSLGGRVVVHARHEGDAIRVSVADTGVGIRGSDLARLFRPFERLDNPLSAEAGGTGLGLAISRKFVELHGGRIWAESRERVGSTFHFTLPVAPAAAPRAVRA